MSTPFEMVAAPIIAIEDVRGAPQLAEVLFENGGTRIARIDEICEDPV